MDDLVCCRYQSTHTGRLFGGQPGHGRAGLLSQAVASPLEGQALPRPRMWRRRQRPARLRLRVVPNASISQRCLGGGRLGGSLASGRQHVAQARQDVSEGGPRCGFGGPARLHERAVVRSHVRRHLRLEPGEHLEQHLRACPGSDAYAGHLPSYLQQDAQR